MYQKKNSSNQSAGTDGLTNINNRTSIKKPGSNMYGLAFSDPEDRYDPDFYLGEVVDEGFAPTSAAPPRITPEKIKAIFVGPVPRPINLLDFAKDEVDLGRLVAPFKGPEAQEVMGFDLNISQAPWFEDAISVLFAFFNKFCALLADLWG
jgi:hypothetical protein